MSDGFDFADRPILPTLAALFVAVAGGQLFSAVSGGTAHAAKSPRLATASVAVSPVAEGDASFASGSTADGITIVDDRRNVESVEDWDAKIKAERYRLRKERAALEAEQDRLSVREQALDAKSAEQHRHLAAMYARMPASKAAAVLTKLKPAEAATFVALMPGEAGADILAAMPADAAVAITREVLTRTTAAAGAAN